MNRKIIEYTTLINNTIGDLDDVISHYIKKGWEPFKAMLVLNRNNVPDYFQAMVKYAPEESKLDDKTLDVIASELVELKVEVDNLKNELHEYKKVIGTPIPTYHSHTPIGMVLPSVGTPDHIPVHEYKVEFKDSFGLLSRKEVLEHILDKKHCHLNCRVCPYNKNGVDTIPKEFPMRSEVCTINSSSLKHSTSFVPLTIRHRLEELKNENI